MTNTVIEIKTGDILSVAEAILVHGCNCQGKMNSGIAKQIRTKWPAVYEAYYERHEKTGLQLGDIVAVGREKARHIHAASDQLPKNLVVVNAMTQFFYGQDKNTLYVDYEAVFSAFARVSLIARDTGLPVHFPLIGCGLANGKWEEVSMAIRAAMPKGTKLTLWKLPQ
jgi:O-acetyl-ADP-ribose deacetylase (regulator of RNase III)